MKDTESPSQPADPPPVVRHAKRWGILLVLLGALAGGLLGWASQEPIYRSEGLVFVQPRLENPEDPCGPGQLPMFQGFMAYQVQLLLAHRTTQLAMETENWKATGEGADAVAALWFEGRRSVVRESGSQFIVVRFEDPNPEVALAGVRALLEAYESLIAADNEADKRLEYVTSQREVQAAQIEEIEKQIIELTQEFGGVEGLEIRHRAAVEQLLETEAELAKVQQAILHAESDGGTSSEELRQAEQALVERLEALRARSRRLGKIRAEVERLNREREDLERQLEQMERIADQLECQLVGSGTITVKDRGALPTEPIRRTPTWPPAVGGALGALLGLLFAWMLARRR